MRLTYPQSTLFELEQVMSKAEEGERNGHAKMHNSHADIGQINFLSYLTGAQARPLCRAGDVSLDRRLAPAQHVKKLKKQALFYGMSP